MRRHDDLPLGLAFASIVLNVVIWIGIIWVAIHFIRKFW